MKEEQSSFDFDGGVRYLEDALEADLPGDDKTLTDAELEKAGLVKTAAFVRSRRSKNALRIERTREKLKSEGIKQVNVQIPERHAEVIKQFAKDLAAGEEPADAAKKIAGDNDFALTQNQYRQAPERPAISKKEQRILQLGSQVEKIAAKGGVRLFFLKLAGIELN